MKSCVLIGNAKLNEIDNNILSKKFDYVYSFCNNISLTKSVKFNELIFIIQSFTLNFQDYDDEFKYVRYKKAKYIKQLGNNTKTILFGKKNNDNYVEFEKLNIFQKINHRQIVRAIFIFFGYKKLFKEMFFLDFFKLLIVFLGFKKQINSGLRPSSGYYILIDLINSGFTVYSVGITNPSKKYISSNVKLDKRPHTFFDKLIYDEISNKKLNCEIW